MDDAFTSEKCYLDNNRVLLLYKLITWWNNSDPGDEKIICGKQLRCELTTKTNIRYNCTEKLLVIHSDYLIEELISIFHNCENVENASYLACTHLNKKYFGTISSESFLPINNTINIIKIKNVEIDQATQLIKQEKNISIEIEGRVEGLLQNSGKIALHRKGDFLKNCPQSSNNEMKIEKIMLTIKNFKTHEIILKYNMFNSKKKS